MLYSWIKNRELGFKNDIGDIDRVYNKVYSSFEPVKSWDDGHDGPGGSVEYGGIFNLEFSLDGSLLVAACEKKSIVLFDPTTAKPIRTIFNAHQNCVNCVKFLCDRIFATCSDDSTVAIWDTRNLKSKLKVLHGHSNWVKNIEYSKKDELLVTSGFDGSIYTWDINSTTESGFIFQKVFHTSGLMRCRVSADASRLVICTTGGYLIIIHNLDLTKLADDLHGFKPNVFRLMQIGGQYFPHTANFKHLFSRNQKRNRVEFITDFPVSNDAEIISALQIHPQGWCALSRNISYDESSEWTCVHDIQETDNLTDDEDIIDENKENPNIIPQPTSLANPNSNQHNIQLMLNRNRANRRQRLANRARAATALVANTSASSSSSNASASSNNTDRNRNSSWTAARETYPPDIWAAEVTIRNRVNGQNAPASDAAHVYGINSGLIRTPIVTSDASSTVINTSKNVYQNRRRLLYYKVEPNKGKRFIKELCFSSDGRIVCSPYCYGVRLLAFNKNCSELPFTLNAENKPQELHVVKTIKSHSNIVVSTKFSPKQPLLVSGCLQGKVVWNHTAL